MTASKTHDEPDPQTGRDAARDDGAAADGDPEATAGSDDTPTQATGDETATADEQQAEPADPEQLLADMEDRWLRAKAENENTRRRARRDVEEARKFGASAMLNELLPALDALQRALASSSADEGGALREGLVLTEEQFTSALRRLGVKAIEIEPGQPLDPSLHRALLEQPSDTYEPGSIVAEITRGYVLHGRLLREAEVSVARRPDDSD